MHTRVSGVSDYIAEDDAGALRLGRLIVSHLAQSKPAAGLARRAAPESPAYDPDELLSIIPADPRIPYDVRGGIRFMEQAHVKDVVAFLSVVANPPRVGSRST